MSPPVRLLSLYWSLDKPPAIIHRVCGDRVMERGENHQTLRADPVSKGHEEAIWMFINNTEELSDEEVDEVIDMDVEEDLEQGLSRAIDGCVRILGVEKPSQERVGEALAVARAYTVAKKKADAPKKETKQPRYYGFLPEIDIAAVVEDAMSQPDISNVAKSFWEDLKSKSRVTTRPHITIVHSKSLAQEQDLWDRCQEMFLSPSPPVFEFKLGHIILNERVMAVTLYDLMVHTHPDRDTHEGGNEFVEKLDETIKNRLHITVGTLSDDIAPVEAKALVDAWRRGQTDSKVITIPLESSKVVGRIKGLYS